MTSIQSFMRRFLSWLSDCSSFGFLEIADCEVWILYRYYTSGAKTYASFFQPAEGSAGPVCGKRT